MKTENASHQWKSLIGHFQGWKIPFPLLLFCRFQDIIGQGSFGIVYKGILTYGIEIAVKKICKQHFHENNPHFAKNFDNFIGALKVIHGYPVSYILPLMAISFTGNYRTGLYLITEYMPNGSLKDRLIRKNNSQPLTW